MDLSVYSYSELRQLAQQVESALERQQTQLISQAREAIAVIAKGVGMDVAALLKLQGPKEGAKSARAPLPPRYVNPDDATQTWTGVGMAPRWVRQHTDAGGLKEALRIVERK